MTTSAPRLTDAIAVRVASALARVTSLRICRIEAYDRTKQTADITPLAWDWLPQPDGSSVVAQLPRVDGVPCAHIGGGGVSLTWDYAAGDLVIVGVRDVSHDEVDGGRTATGEPASLRRWSWADAVVLGAFAAPTSPLPSAAVSASGPVLRLPDGDALRVGDSTAAKALALAEKVATQISRIETEFNTHTHVLTIAVGGGSGTAAVPANQVTPTTTPADVSTDLIKVTA